MEKFLKTRPIHGWVGIDRAEVMFKAYGFEGVPDTVLIGADGRIAGITYPSMLKAGHIEDLLAARPVKLPGRQDLSIARAGDDGSAPLLDMIVRPSAGGGGGAAWGGGKFQVKGYTIRHLLSQATNVPPDFVVGEAADDSTPYDVSLTVPRASSAAFQKLVPDILCLAFHVTMRRETRDTDGWILKAPQGKPDALKEATSGGGTASCRAGKLNMTGGSMDQLAAMIRGVVHKPVADRTGIPGTFDLALKYDEKQPESILDVLRGLGFTIEPGVVPTEFLVVSR